MIDISSFFPVRIYGPFPWLPLAAMGCTEVLIGDKSQCICPLLPPQHQGRCPVQYSRPNLLTIQKQAFLQESVGSPLTAELLSSSH